MKLERQQAIDGQLGNGKPPDSFAARILKWCKNFAGAVGGAISSEKGGQQEGHQGSEDRTGTDLDRIRKAWESSHVGEDQKATDQTEGRKLGPPEVIEQFNKIDIRLSYRDDGTYSDWCVFPDSASTFVIVSSSYNLPKL